MARARSFSAFISGPVSSRARFRSGAEVAACWPKGPYGGAVTLINTLAITGSPLAAIALVTSGGIQISSIGRRTASGRTSMDVVPSMSKDRHGPTAGQTVSGERRRSGQAKTRLRSQARGALSY